MKNPWSGLKDLPHAMWILSGTVLINRCGTLVLPFLVLYLTRDRHLSASTAGAIVALYGVGALFTAPLSGWITDRYGTVPVMKFSLFSSSVVLFVFPFAKSLPAIAAATLLFAIAAEMFRPASLAMISTVVRPEQRKAAFALARLAINIGMSIGPAIGGFLASVSFLYLFLIDGGTSLVAAIALALAKLPATGKQDTLSHANSDVAPNNQSAASNRQLMIFLLAVILICIVFFQHLSALPLFMVRYLKLSSATYGLMFTLNTTLIILLEVPLNFATAHWTYRRSLVCGTILFATGFGFLMFATGIWLVIVSVLIWTFGEMILFPAMSAFVAHVSPQDRQGAYMGWYTMAFSVAFIVGPWLGTFLLDHYGVVVVWGSMLVIGLLSTSLMLIQKEPQPLAA